MTSLEISTVTGAANLIGKPFGVECRYEWDRKKQRFQWNFYRRGRFIGGTAKQDEVVKKMDRYVETK